MPQLTGHDGRSDFDPLRHATEQSRKAYCVEAEDVWDPDRIEPHGLQRTRLCLEFGDHFDPRPPRAHHTDLHEFRASSVSPYRLEPGLSWKPSRKIPTATA